MLDRVLEIMEEYDIKHPLRGDKYNAYSYKQPFNERIRRDITDLKSFLKYKRDARGVLEQSVMRSDEFMAAERKMTQERRCVMRYRLFGRDGVTKKEFEQLITLGIVKKRENYDEMVQMIEQRARR